MSLPRRRFETPKQELMALLLAPFRFLYNLYALITFVAIMLLVFPFAVGASFFGRIKGGNMILRLCMFWADTWFPLVFIYPKKIFEAPHDKQKPYVFVTNHISYLDSALLVKAFRQPVRPLGKVEMAKIPVFGFIYSKAIVTVDRSSAENRVQSIRILRSIISKGISVLVFPEGTFNNSGRPLKDFYDGAFRVAIETQTSIKPVLFLDNYDRLNYHSFFSLTPGRNRIVYLEEVPISGYRLDDTAQLKQKVFDIMKDKLIEYQASWIEAPTST
jgi:1-acyl-sn-glycerol-3-phosphate acyltransferase